MESFDDGIKREFLLEAAEIIEEVEAVFLSLEKNPDDHKILDHIFRLIHTVKGSAYSAGFEELGTFAHTFETLLNILREGRIKADSDIVDLLLRSNDLLKKFIEVLTRDEHGTLDTSTVNEELLAAIGDEAPVKWTGPAFGFFDDDPAPTPVREDEFLSEVEAPAPIVPVPVVNLMNTGPKLMSVLEPLILVCDDEPAIVDLIQEILAAPELGRVRVITAFDGQEAVDKIHSVRPHLVITDLRMPRLSGSEFIRHLRERDPNVPVIVLSGFAERADMIDFIKMGVTDYQDKPIRSRQMVLSVMRCLRISQMREAVSRLSILNLRAHIATDKLMHMRDDSVDKVQDQTSKIQVMLDEIALLTNFILTL